MNRLYRTAVRALLVMLVCRAQALAATVPPGFSETLVASGLSNPTAMTFAPDGRLFVCLQGGQVRVIENGRLLAAPFVTLTVDSSGERGLLGLAFDPNFSTNHYVYIYYTATTPSTHNRVARLIANGNVAVGGSEVPILDLDNLNGATNHNGGGLHFGIDGKLYIGVGENAKPSNAQSLNNLFGKILRINADGTIPPDNPFITQTTRKNHAIWALGLSNPSRFAFEPLSGRLLINDVGQNTYDEIDEGFAGFNYGWPESEGPTSNPNHTGPIHGYPHVRGPVAGCAITGGTFYNPGTMQFPSSFLGTYFFADSCGGWIKYLDPGNNNTVTGFAAGISNPVDLRVGPDGDLYYLARSAGAIFRIFYTGSATREEAVLVNAAARTNVALASAGAVAVGSSTVTSGFAASGAINGDRKGVGWGAGGGWNDGTPSVFPDWLEVDFSGTHTIDEIDVFTLQDNYSAPSDPTPTMTFTGYGLRDFDVQYWNGAAWQTVAGGQITGNNNVWRTIAFTAVSTTRIRVYVTNALAGYSRIVEVEAYESTGPANSPPTVTVTNPTEGSSFAASTPISVQATAGDTDGTVTRVDFYANGTLAGSDTTNPYAFTWTPTTPGPYTLTAVATDNLDATTTSAAVHVTITGASGGRTNVALASAGAVAVASSTANSGFAASSAINGDRKGVGWGAGGGWNDGTPSVFPDWLEVDFNGTHTIDEIDVFTLQDNYSAPSDPTAGMTFTGYGLRDFDVQYWNGAAWQTVAGGQITGNNNVWRTIAFTAVSTARIRVYVTNALGGYSRIVEVEAYEGTGPANTPPTVTVTNPTEGSSFAASTPISLQATAGDTDGTVTRVDFYANGTLAGSDTTNPYAFTWTPTTPGPYTLTAVATDNLDATTTSAAVHVTITGTGGGRTNVALASAGAVAVASSTANSGFTASSAINGDRKGVGWGAGGGWNDGTPGAFPDWLEVDFNGTHTIDEIDVFTLQDNYSSPSDPTPTMTFTGYGLRDFDVQYWNGGSWQAVANGQITGNTNVWRTVAFPAVSTNRIRIFVTNALAGYSRIVEVEAYSGGVPDTQPPVLTNLQPVNGSTVSGPVAFSVTATDDVHVAGVQFQIDGANFGSEDQVAPYSAAWDSFSASNGTHVVTAVARDGAGNTASVSATVTVSNTLTTSFPLKVGTNLRHLVDQNSVPFLVNGDAAWSLIVGLQKPDVSVYLSDRRARGFNTLLVELIEHHFSVNPPRNAYGDAPFTTPGDFSTPNESYFAHADWVINEAAARGMLVLLTPAYLGYQCGGEGWCQEMNANGTTKMFNYGVYVGNRYKNFKNIIWVHGGDTNANAYAGTGDVMRAVINGIKSVDGPRVHTGHCGPETSALDCYNEAWLDVNTTYSGCTKSAVRTQTDYNRARMMPFFYIEGKYENEGASDVCLRSQAYWSILGGSSGHVFGNNPIWSFTGPAWQQALNSPGAQSMANVGALFRTRAWQTLVPDYLHQVVTAGYGDINNATYVPAARASDGSMAIAYLPGGGTITVDMSRLSRSANARWYDPAAGTFTSIAGSPFANTGSRNFTTPGTNAGGSVDWVLVLEITP